MKELLQDSELKDRNMVSEQISVGSRVEVAGFRGTVKYVGEVSGTEGIWLGVDWDDPERGKHNGNYLGVQYFQASYPTSGSFVRPGKVNFGISIIEAIEAKYGLSEDSYAGVDPQSMWALRRNIKATLFEVVGATKINRIQSDFRNLLVVVLRDSPVSGAGPPLAVFRLCPLIEELDLSKTLINSWETVAEIALQLKNLKILNLSENRLRVFENVDCESCESLQHVILGRILYNWFQVLRCSEFFLNVEFLQVHYNKIEILEAPSKKIFSHLKSLDLEGNPIKSWDEVNKLGNIPTLELLNLTNCGLREVHFPCSEMSLELTSLFKNLRTLILTKNEINDWPSVSQLDKLKSLKEVKLRGNPILAKETLETSHQLIIARIKNLEMLNGEKILGEERRGAEIDYLKRFGTDWLKLKTEEEKVNFNKLHPSYQRLVEKYGAPEEGELKKLPTSLKSQLIQLEIVSQDKSFTKKVPYNMSVQKLSGLIQRLFNTGSTMPQLSCIHSQRSDVVEIPLEDNLKDLNFYSVENGDKIFVRW